MGSDLYVTGLIATANSDHEAKLKETIDKQKIIIKKQNEVIMELKKQIKVLQGEKYD